MFPLLLLRGPLGWGRSGGGGGGRGCRGGGGAVGLTRKALGCGIGVLLERVLFLFLLLGDWGVLPVLLPLHLLGLLVLGRGWDTDTHPKTKTEYNPA